MASLYTETFQKVNSYIQQNSGNEDQAKDIFQEAFVVVWQKVKSGEFIPQNASAIQGFLFQVSKNKWLDFLRSARVKKEVFMRSFTPEVSDPIESEYQEEKFMALETAFVQLGENCKNLLKLFYFEKISLQDLARRFGWTTQTTKNNKYRCMENLRKLLNP